MINKYAVFTLISIHKHFKMTKITFFTMTNPYLY